MSKLRILILTLCAAIALIALGNYATNYSKLNKESSAELLKKGDDFAFNKNNPDSAIIYYTVLTQRSEEKLSDNEMQDVIDAYTNLWFVYYINYYDYVSGNEMLQRALALAEDADVKKAYLYFNLGSMYQGVAALNDDRTLYSNATAYYRKALGEPEITQKYNLLSTTYLNIVSIAQSTNDIKTLDEVEKSALAWLAKNPDYRKDIKFRLLLLEIEAARALLAKDYDTALHKYRDEIELLAPSEAKEARNLISAYTNLSELLSKLGRHDEAMLHVEKAILLSKTYNYPDYNLLLYAKLASILANKGDNNKALEYKIKFLEAKDSCLNYRQIASVNEMSGYNRKLKVEKEISRIKRREANLNRTLMIVGAVIVFICVILSVIYFKNRKLKEANRMLYTRIQDMLKEEDSGKKPTCAGEDEPMESDIPAEDDASAEKYKKTKLSEEQKKEYLSKILAAIDGSDAIYQPDFSADTLEQLTGIRYKYISQLINETYSKNFNTFINEYRVKQACRLISIEGFNRGFTLESLANKVGFRSRTSFNTAFRKLTGMTPSEYVKIAGSQR